MCLPLNGIFLMFSHLILAPAYKYRLNGRPHVIVFEKPEEFMYGLAWDESDGIISGL